MYEHIFDHPPEDQKEDQNGEQALTPDISPAPFTNSKFLHQKSVPQTQNMLEKLKTMLDLPINFKPRGTGYGNSIDQKQQWMKNTMQGFGKLQSKVVKKEEYFIDNTPIELSSILIKVLVELLVKIGTV